MANYCGTGRSNYFQVKDVAAYKTWLAKFPDIEYIQSDDAPEEDPLVGFLSNLECGSLPSFYYVGDEEKEVDFLDELSQHLVDGSVAVFVTAGSEKQRYVSGHAIAINSQGEQEYVSLSDIYTKAEKLGKEVTPAEY